MFGDALIDFSHHIKTDFLKNNHALRWGFNEGVFLSAWHRVPRCNPFLPLMLPTEYEAMRLQMMILWGIPVTAADNNQLLVH